MPETNEHDTELEQSLQSYYQHLYGNPPASEQIWGRVAPLLGRQEQKMPWWKHLLRWKLPEEKIHLLKEKPVREEKNILWGNNASLPVMQAKKRGLAASTMGISLITVAVITIVSFTIFSGVLRSALQTTDNRSSISTSTSVTTRNTKLVCSVSVNVESTARPNDVTTHLDWSTQGEIAALSPYSLSPEKLTIFSAKDCSTKVTKQTSFYGKWSPDGKKLVVADDSSYALNVLDRNGNSIANIPYTHLSAIDVGALTWSSDSTKLIFVSYESNHEMSIKSVNVATGGLMTLSASTALGDVEFSPGGKYFLQVQYIVATRRKEYTLWDVNTGKKIRDLPSAPAVDGKGGYGAEAFSPDGSLFAVGGNGKIRIYSTADGQLQSSFNTELGMNDLVWSPNGKYLAESTTSINIYDVKAGKLVTTFGQDDAHYEIFGLAWAPDSRGLVSSTNVVPNDYHFQTLVSVWTLS